jgi:SET domain
MDEGYCLDSPAFACFSATSLESLLIHTKVGPIHLRRCLLKLSLTMSGPSATSTESSSYSLVDCSRVAVRESPLGGLGAFAAVDIMAGEKVETGIARRLTNCDGNENPYVFTWSDEVPCTTWAIGSGCSTFYNTVASGGEQEPNTKMARNFANDTFEIFASRDIKAGEELLHVYKSKGWRKCFQSLN